MTQKSYSILLLKSPLKLSLSEPNNGIILNVITVTHLLAQLYTGHWEAACELRKEKEVFGFCNRCYKPKQNLLCLYFRLQVRVWCFCSQTVPLIKFPIPNEQKQPRCTGKQEIKPIPFPIQHSHLNSTLVETNKNNSTPYFKSSKVQLSTLKACLEITWVSCWGALGFIPCTVNQVW